MFHISTIRKIQRVCEEYDLTELELVCISLQATAGVPYTIIQLQCKWLTTKEVQEAIRKSKAIKGIQKEYRKNTQLFSNLIIDNRIN